MSQRMRVLALVGAAMVSVPLLAPPEPKLTILDGTRPDGSATDLWLAILRRRLTPHQYDSVAGLRRSRLPAEESWAHLIRQRRADWPRLTPALLTLFDSLVIDSVRIVLGDRGGEDAFTHDSMTMGFDLAALERVYGPASEPENPDRLDRLFQHEFVHLLQKRWLGQHPYPVSSPVQAALLDAWAEGLGNYYSLSPRWHATGGVPSALTAKALDELQPRFVARMSALACADSLTARPLLADLSAGPFTQKWGALPVALWLLAEVDSSPGALRRFAGAGPPGVLPLATRHLPPGLRDSLAVVTNPDYTCPAAPGT